jgi:hypothetical protein
MRGYFNGVAAAMPFTAAMGVAQYQAQGKIGKYNQSVQNRNAKVLEGQATQIEQKAEFDVAQFQKQFRKLEGETTVALAKSGVQLGTGSAYNIELSNAGTIARNEAKMAQIGTIASTGSLLYGMKNT